MTTDPGLSAVLQGTSAGECAVRMARAGARLLGVNCLFDPFLCLDTVRQMRAGLEAAGGSRVTCRHHCVPVQASRACT